MNVFDSSVTTYVNQFSQHSWILDNLICSLEHNNLLKGGVLVAVLWWAWFKSDKFHSYNREHIISTLLSCFVAMVSAKALMLTLPFRLRPLHEVGLNFILPYGMKSTTLEGWSSFPSDHAALFFTLSTGLLFISKKVGAFALAYTALFICFPRIYLGLHYPTDIIGGVIIGVIIGWLGNIYIIRSKISQLVLKLSHSKPSLFYPLFFLLTYQIVDIFQSSRAIIDTGLKFFQSIPS